MLFLRKILLAAALSIAAAFPAAGQSIQLLAGQIIGNSTAAQRQGRAENVTSIIDRAISSTRGSILERGAGGWVGVGPGTAGLAWVSAGAGADPSYAVVGLNGGGCNAALTASLGGIVYSTATACAVLPGTATARQMLQSGASAAPAWSTTTWPATTTINRILFSSAANVISEIATANSSILVTDSGGIPSLSTTLPAHTLGGTVSGGGNQINNVIIGTSTPLAGSFTSLAYSTTLTGTSTNASCVAVGRLGATTPAFQVDCSTGTQVAGVKVTGAATGGTVTIEAIDSGSNANITIKPKGSGTVTIGGAGAGAITVQGAGGGGTIFNIGVAGSTGATINVAGSSSGSQAWVTAAAASGTATMFAGTDTVVGNSVAATLTTKVINCANNTCTVRLANDISGFGANVTTLLGNAVSAAAGPTSTIASGTSALGTSAISSATCATVVTTAATNTATTDAIIASFNGDPTAVTGYVPLTSGMLTIIVYPTANNVNFKVCNNTSASITPGAITLNWRVVR